MTNKEQFEVWFKANSKQTITDYGFGTFSEDVMFSAWQAAWVEQAIRIAELEARNKELEALAEQPTNMVTVPLDVLEDMQRRLKELPIGIDAFPDRTQPTVAELNDEYLRDTHVEGLSTQEPVTYAMGLDTEGYAVVVKLLFPLYTHPKQWQGLSDDEITRLYVTLRNGSDHKDFARAIEAKLREKNG